VEERDACALYGSIAKDGRPAHAPIGAALAAFCFSIGNGKGPLLALSLGVAFSAVGSAASFYRLRFRNDGPVTI